MDSDTHHVELERLNQSLANSEIRVAYKARHDGYRLSLIPRFFGATLIFFGNLVYGYEPSYLKFRSIEIIARVPYQSWASSAFTLLTVFFSNEAEALKLSRTARYAEFAQANETMHVVVISQLAEKEERAGMIRHSLVPMLFAFFYFWVSYILHLVCPRYSYELNYVFENHAYEQYGRFLDIHEIALKQKEVKSVFLHVYGRHPQNQYEFFRSVQIDELIHRNTAIEDIKQLQSKTIK